MSDDKSTGDGRVNFGQIATLDHEGAIRALEAELTFAESIKGKGDVASQFQASKMVAYGLLGKIGTKSEEYNTFADVVEGVYVGETTAYDARPVLPTNLSSKI